MSVAGTPPSIERLRWRLRVRRVSEARSELLLVVAGGGPSLRVEGDVFGPICEYATTLAAKRGWTPIESPSSQSDIVAFQTIIDECCLWEPAHPFRYACRWRFADEQGEQAAEVGFRSIEVKDRGLFVNGTPAWWRGVSATRRVAERLKEWHDWGVDLLWIEEGRGPAECDRFGPFTVAWLDDDPQLAAAGLLAAGPQLPSLALWLSRIDRPDEDWRALRRIDRTSLLGQVVSATDRSPKREGPDLLVLSGPTVEIATASETCSLPWLARIQDEPVGQLTSREDWNALAARLDHTFRGREGCVGWIVDAGA